MFRLTLGLTGVLGMVLTLGCRDDKDLYGTDETDTTTTPDETDDTGTDGTDDTETTDTETTDSTTDTALPTPGDGEALVFGGVVDPDGQPVATSMQFCSEACLGGESFADGSFYKIVPIDDINHSYKVDAIGEYTEGESWGRIRVHVDLDEYEEAEFVEALQMPTVSPAEQFPSESGMQTLELGDINFRADPSDFTFAFGFDTWGIQAGVVVGGPDYWDVAHELAVAMVPFDTVVDGPISVSFPIPADVTTTEWDVYYVDEKGKGAGPIGVATVNGANIQIEDAAPSTLSWLLLVPAL